MMLLATLVVVVALLGVGTCSTVTCSYYCTRSVRYTARCGTWNWWKCTRYRAEGSTCYRTGLNGEWSSWTTSSVGTCSTSCGSGTRLRTSVRYCNNPAPTDCGSSCPGASTKSEYESCNQGCCPVNGNWSVWQLQNTSSCSVTCGGGTRAVTYRRVCNNPTPICGGVTCSGSTINIVQESCNTQNCPVDGGWSSWYPENNGTCSVTCGGGEMNVTYRRNCDNPAPQFGGNECVGDVFRAETLSCNTQECPIDGGWSSWQLDNNGSCSVTCGGGERNATYTRYCDSPAPQYGGQECGGDRIRIETLACNTQQCPIDGGWSSWYLQDNGTCSVTCRGGEKNVTYRRNCDNPAPQFGGAECVGDDVRAETLPCNTQECPIDGGWSSWYPENNGTCSVTCGGGEMNVTYRRNCDNPAPQFGGNVCGGDDVRAETLSCNTQECQIDGGWSSWQLDNNGSCSVTCGGGERNLTYTRKCDSPAPLYGGAECSGESTSLQTSPCNTEPCPIDGGWSSWYLENNGACSVTCGGEGVMNVTYRRYCDNPAPQYGGTDCDGSNTLVETLPCNSKPCPNGGYWGDWGAWRDVKECSALCGGGQKTQRRERNCHNPAPADGGRTCDGAGQESETVVCNQEDCGGRCPENSVTFIPHPNNTRRYYQCDNGVALLMSCGVGTVWDQQAFTCVNDNSSQNPNGGDDNICATDGYQPDKDDCTKYYLCVEGNPFELSCPAGLAFNAVISSCDVLDKVSCRVSN